MFCGTARYGLTRDREFIGAVHDNKIYLVGGHLGTGEKKKYLFEKKTYSSKQPDIHPFAMAIAVPLHP